MRSRTPRGLPGALAFDAVVAGVSGYDGRVYGLAAAAAGDAVLLRARCADRPRRRAGRRAGVVVIAGTGSVVYARDGVDSGRTLGGWGFLFGDEGSAFRYRARGACRRSCARTTTASRSAARRRQPASSSGARRCASLRAPSMPARSRAIGWRPSHRRHSGSIAFARLRDRGADRLAELIAAAASRAVPRRRSPSSAASLPTRFPRPAFRAVLAAVPGARIVRARHDPAPAPSCSPTASSARGSGAADELARDPPRRTDRLGAGLAAARRSTIRPSSPRWRRAAARRRRRRRAHRRAVEYLRAVRARVELPIVGLIKREYAGLRPVHYADVGRGARDRRGRRRDRRIRCHRAPRPAATTLGGRSLRDSRGRTLAMADCATAADALCAQRRGRRHRGDDALRIHRRDGRPPRSRRSILVRELAKLRRVYRSAKAGSTRRPTCAPRSMPEPMRSSSAPRSRTSIGSCASLQGLPTELLKPV